MAWEGLKGSWPSQWLGPAEDEEPGEEGSKPAEPSAAMEVAPAVRTWELLMKVLQVSGALGLLPDTSLVLCSAVPPSWVWGGSWVRAEAVVQLWWLCQELGFNYGLGMNPAAGAAGWLALDCWDPASMGCVHPLGLGQGRSPSSAWCMARPPVLCWPFFIPIVLITEIALVPHYPHFLSLFFPLPSVSSDDWELR